MIHQTNRGHGISARKCREQLDTRSGGERRWVGEVTADLSWIPGLHESLSELYNAKTEEIGKAQGHWVTFVARGPESTKPNRHHGA